MKLDSALQVGKYLVEAGIARSDDHPQVEILNGGVSSSVWSVRLNGHHWVLKQALEKLKVEADWFSDIERIHREHEAMQALHNVIPAGSIPRVLHADYTHHIYMMESANEIQTWKDMLMGGDFNDAVAENAGRLLRNIHGGSERIPAADKARFQDLTYFIQLRVDPFHRSIMQRYPALSASIQLLIDEVTMQGTCMVHGDFSPKNMLVQAGNHIVLIDFEVAHWGNPVFDLAYCVGHLMLKGWHLKRKTDSLRSIRMFLSGYGRPEGNLVPHLGLMLLARMDGKSPVNYIKDEDLKNRIREIAIDLIRRPSGSTNVLPVIQQVFGERT